MDHLSNLTIGQGAILLAAFGSLLYLITAQLLQQNKASLRLPPSPPKLPLIGSLIPFLSAVKKHELHLLFEKWAKELGAVYRVKIGPFTQ